MAEPGEEDAGPDAPDPLLGTSVGGFRMETLLEGEDPGPSTAARDEPSIGAWRSRSSTRRCSRIPARGSVSGARPPSRRAAHPHIVPVFAAGEDEGLAWIAMMFVEGESLDAVIRRRGRGATDLPSGAIARLGATSPTPLPMPTDSGSSTGM